MKIVLIKWVDSCHYSGWQSFNEYERIIEDEDLNILTVGFLGKETEKCLTVIQSGGHNNVDAIMKIPKCCVISVQEIGEAELDLTPVL